MASLGAAKTGKFQIGTAELRVGPLSMAGKLTQAHSVGLIDTATLTVDQTSVDLKGGFPQVIMDTQVTDQSASIVATLREFSRRNLGVMLGQGLTYDAAADGVADAKTFLTAGIDGTTTPVVSIALDSATGFDLVIDADDPRNTWQGWVVIYDPALPGSSVITRLTAGGATLAEDEGAATGALDPNFAINTVLPAGAIVAKLAPIAMGAVFSVNYFTAQLLTLDRQTGRPRVHNFWKVATGSGMSLANNATDFASTEMNLRVLQPTLADYSENGPMAHLSEIIPRFPMGIMGEMSDAALAAGSVAPAP